MHKQSKHTKLKTLVLICISTLALLMGACKKDTKPCNDECDPNCPNYINPCSGKIDAKADFGIYEGMGYYNLWFETDTVFYSNLVNVKAKFKADNYKWRISCTNTIYTDSVVNLTGKIPNGGFVTVTLIASNNISNCNKLKGVDSVTKVFYGWPLCGGYGATYNQWPVTYLPIMGTYKGVYQSNPSQEVYVTLFDTLLQSFSQLIVPCNTATTKFYNVIRGLPYPNISLDNTLLTRPHGSFITGVGASYIVINRSSIFGRLDTLTSSHCNGVPGTFPVMNAIAWLDYDNSKKIYINVNHTDTLNNQIKYHDFFTGYKVN